MKETPTARHHREWAEAQDKMGSMHDDGEKLKDLPKYEVRRDVGHSAKGKTNAHND
jgi:hypothetical protein